MLSQLGHYPPNPADQGAGRDLARSCLSWALPLLRAQMWPVSMETGPKLSSDMVPSATPQC